MSEFKKTDEVKVLRDPIHGYIHIDLQVVWDVLNSSWFQRLRRIRQLGGAQMVYHSAEHTRFAHSLGVYEIVRRMVNEVKDIKETLTEEEKVTVMLAGLLHDVGHGPYSHTMESITGCSHEEFTCRIIEEDTEITRILEGAKKGLAKSVADVIAHKASNPILSQLISSQVDADRMDYLLRDAYFTGTAYGQFDLERILRTMRIHDHNVVIKQSGVYAIENYIMSRYHMYWQVYFHPVARSYEYILHALFRRLFDLGDVEDMSLTSFFKPLIKKEPISLEEFFAMDDYSFSYAFAKLSAHQDSIVKDFALRLRDRNLFDYANENDARNEKRKEELKNKGYDLNYYWGTNVVEQKPYIPYTEDSDNAIWILMEDNTTSELSTASSIVHSLIHGPSQDDNKVFYPKEI